MVVLAGLFAGAETGVYQLSRLRLRLGIEKRQLLFVLLGKVMRDSAALLLSLLIATNLAYYLATSFVTYILLAQMAGEHTAELFATLCTAPILFVFSELIPKNIFFYRADFLMPYVAPVLFVWHRLLTWCGAVPLLKGISSVFARLTVSPVPSKTIITAVQKYHVRSILQDTHEEGILSSVQVNIIDRLVSISHIRVRSIMTPINRVQMVDLTADKAALLAKLKEHEFTRLLVYEHRPADIVGFINIYEVLSSPDSFSDLRRFVKPIGKLGANTAVIDAINTMRTQRQEIILVVRQSPTGRERPIGIVTMKDLVEELLGELAQW
jgi:CBS domain containing-hemolysin-like protein